MAIFRFRSPKSPAGIFFSFHLAVSAAGLVLAAPIGAQGLVGFSPARVAQQRAAESAATARPDSARIQTLARALADRPHIAGTPAQARTRDLVIEALRAAGVETEVREYQVWLPHTVDYGVWRITPNPVRLELREGEVPEDPTTLAHPEYPTVNGYSGSGDVTGEVVYVNYGLVEDYARLDSLGVSVKGKVAIARYGRSFRGIKAREAEQHGAVALLMYSDPADDGYVQGDVYPEGPYRNARGVQRGSVMNGAGDPSTPGYPSTANAKRIPLGEMPVPRIPVLPLSFGLEQMHILNECINKRRNIFIQVPQDALQPSGYFARVRTKRMLINPIANRCVIRPTALWS